jgi:hypothetical protein
MTEGVACWDNNDVGDHVDLTGGANTTSSDNEEDQHQNSSVSTETAWETNTWRGDPIVTGTFLSKKSSAYFSQEMQKTTMGNHYLVQHAFNTCVEPEDLSTQEVNFQLNLCSIFHGITRRNQTKLAGVFF